VKLETRSATPKASAGRRRTQIKAEVSNAGRITMAAVLLIAALILLPVLGYILGLIVGNLFPIRKARN